MRMLRVVSSLLLLSSFALPIHAGNGPDAAQTAILTTLRAFVTSAAGNGDLSTWGDVSGLGLSGVEAGDKICQLRAEAGGLATEGVPEFVAWLSDASTDAYCHVQGLTGTKAGGCGGGGLPGAGPWTRVDGLPWSEDLDTLTGAPPGNVPFVQMDLDESGQFLSFKTYVTGTDDDGTINNDGRTCGNWMDSGGNYVGSITDSVFTWSGGAASGCGGTDFRLLCLETGPGIAADPPAGAGALVFVTSTKCTGDLGACTEEADSGIDAADNFCKARALAGHLPDPEGFFAWISVTGSDAGDRLSGPGPWRRPDGYLVANDAADWKDSNLAAVPYRDELGGRVIGTDVWTGTNANGTANGTDCTGWTTDVSGNGRSGRAYRASDRWTSNATEACTQQRRLYCLSNEVVVFWNDFEPGGYDRDWSDTVGMP